MAMLFSLFLVLFMAPGELLPAACSGQEKPPEQATVHHYCPGPSFEKITDPELLQKMEQHWPDLMSTVEDQNRDQKLWEEAWNRYGSCTPFEQSEYLGRAVELKNELDLEKVVKDAGFVSGRTYNAAHFRSAIKKGTGYEVELTCEKAPDGTNVFVGINACYTPEMKLFDCPSSSQSPKACKGDFYFA